VNCFDCAALGRHRPAVATCADCGAAICAAHAQVTARWLTRTMPINRVVAAGPPARTIRCGLCQAAAGALYQDANTGEQPGSTVAGLVAATRTFSSVLPRHSSPARRVPLRAVDAGEGCGRE
jgi:hypothetical protein